MHSLAVQFAKEEPPIDTGHVFFLASFSVKIARRETIGDYSAAIAIMRGTATRPTVATGSVRPETTMNSA